jgi:ribosomal protein S27AE
MAINNFIKVNISPVSSSSHQDCFLCGNVIVPFTKMRELVKVDEKGVETPNAVCVRCDNTLSGTYLALLNKKFPTIIATIQNYWNKYLTKTPLEWQA